MKSWYQAGVLAGAASLAILAGTAHADDGNGNQGQGALQVYDSRGKLVGQLANNYDVFTTINNNVYQLEIQRNEGTNYIDAFPTANLWYTNTTCTGQRYLLDYGEVPPKAYYEAAGSPGSRGQTLWTYGSGTQTVALNSYWYGDGGYCIKYTFSPSPVNAVPAVSLGSFPFSPPFCIGGRNEQSCRTEGE